MQSPETHCRNVFPDENAWSASSSWSMIIIIIKYWPKIIISKPGCSLFQCDLLSWVTAAGCPQRSPVYCQKKIVVHLLTLPCLRKHLLLFVLLLLVHNVAPLTCLLLCETILPKPGSISVTVDFMGGQRASAQSVFTQIEERGTVNHLELSASFPASTFRSRRSLHSKPAGAFR